MKLLIRNVVIIRFLDWCLSYNIGLDMINKFIFCLIVDKVGKFFFKNIFCLVIFVFVFFLFINVIRVDEFIM